jgi:hypothetical protein
MSNDFVAVADADTQHRIQLWRCSCLVQLKYDLKL